MPLYACGSNTASHLALGHADDVHILSSCAFHPSVEAAVQDAHIVDLVSASAHSLLLLRLKDGTHLLLGAGTNTLGQLGPRCALWDDVKPQTSFKGVDLRPPELDGGDWEPVKVAAAWTTSYVVYRRTIAVDASSATTNVGQSETEEVLVACGSNDFNELGLPIPDAGRGAITQPSDNPVVVELGLQTGERIQHLKAGQRHVIALIASGDGQARTQRVVGWGAARKGELDASTLPSSQPFQSDGESPVASSKGKGKARANMHPPCLSPTIVDLPIPAGAQIIDLDLGSAHSVALLSNGQVLAWGSDAKGQITSLASADYITGIGTTWGGTYLLREMTAGSEICAQGWNTIPHRSTGSTQRTSVALLDGRVPVELVTGSEHLLVLARPRLGHPADDTLQLFVGGWNEHGNLGLGDTADRGELVLLSPLPAQGPVRGIWGGCASTWVCVGDGVVE